MTAPNMPTALALRKALRCDKSNCRCHKPTGPTHCPAHADTTPSLSVDDNPDSGLPLVYCHSGCTQQDVLDILRQRGLWPASGDGTPKAKRSRGGGGHSPAKKPATAQHSASSEGQQPPQTEEAAPTAPPPGCTLQAYADEKQLPVSFLRDLGLTQFYMGAPVLRIPYRNPDGTEAAIRFRTALHKSEDGDQRFTWRKGSKPLLYGLWRIEEARKAGYIVLVEGESDCHVLWFNEEPAFGIPGATNYREERDAPHLDGIETIYIVIEPDKGGKAVLKWLAASRIRARVRLVRLPDDKDPAALYKRDPAQFRARWKAALEAAQPWSDFIQAEANAEANEAWAACKELAQSPDILAVFADSMQRAGIAGEREILQILYLTVTSRLLDRPVSVAVKGPSSGGKSFTTEKVLAYFPSSAYYARSAMSDRALAYGEETLKHRMLVIYEAAGMQSEMATYLLRSLLSEGRISYETVEKTKDGMKPRIIVREGPTGLIITTTAVNLHAENETRLLTLTVTDTREQTESVLRAQARKFNGSHSTAADLTPWHALQRWLERAEHRVVIPYAEHLALGIPGIAVRLRRDFPTILSLLCTHAILHQSTRERDAGGQIIATLADYAAVRALVADLIAQGVSATVPAIVRATVEAVATLCTGEQTTTLQPIANLLNLDKSAVSRRLKTAGVAGYIINEEKERGRPGRFRLGEPLPADTELLPTVEELRKRCSVADENEERNTPLSPRHAGACPLGDEEDPFVGDKAAPDA